MSYKNPTPSQLDAHQIIKRGFNEYDDSFRIAGGLVTDAFDAVTVTYPSSTQEVYTFRTGGISGPVVATVTVNYTNSTKDSLLNVSRT